MKKKYTVESKDKKDWIAFTKKMENIQPKSSDLDNNKKVINKIPKLDLHGFSLSEANLKVEKFIIECFNNRIEKIIVVTGKGKRSQSHNNPYMSEKLSVLKHSIPEYINSNLNLTNKIKKISIASIQDGGEGAIYVFLKKRKNL